MMSTPSRDAVHGVILTSILFLILLCIVFGAISCGLFTPAFKTKALPTVDFLTLSEVRDTSYCNARTAGQPFSGAFFDTRDSAFDAVEIDSVYRRPLDDFSVRRANDSLGTLSQSWYQREKSILIATYRTLKGGRP